MGGGDSYDEEEEDDPRVGDDSGEEEEDELTRIAREEAEKVVDRFDGSPSFYGTPPPLDRRRRMEQESPSPPSSNNHILGLSSSSSLRTRVDLASPFTTLGNNPYIPPLHPNHNIEDHHLHHPHPHHPQDFSSTLLNVHLDDELNHQDEERSPLSTFLSLSPLPTHSTPPSRPVLTHQKFFWGSDEEMRMGGGGGGGGRMEGESPEGVHSRRGGENERKDANERKDREEVVGGEGSNCASGMGGLSRRMGGLGLGVF